MKIGESIFDIAYLLTVITLGIVMMKKGKTKQYRMFGTMALVLGCGDAFHLIPRVYAMWTTGLESQAAMLGIGQAVTSVTMTVFYVMLYHIWVIRYQVQREGGMRGCVYGLAVLRVILCLCPQNQWMSPDAPLSWGIYRNIPFTVLGVLILILFYQRANETDDQGFKWMWLAILISFGCYLPVVLFAKAVPVVGALMIPKTCAYVWMVMMGFMEMKREEEDIWQEV